MLKWQDLKSSAIGHVFSVYRVKVPGGWLVSVHMGDGVGVTFYPDPNHQWDGSSLN